MNKVKKPMYEWETLPWNKIQKGVLKLQKRIYQASKSGNITVLRKLQRLLLNSWSAKCLAVRKVIQGDGGKKIAMIGGKLALSHLERVNLINSLKLSDRAISARKVWIYQPGKARKSLYGTPKIDDTAKQVLLKLALEPEWEAKFENNSHSFRASKSCHDAVRTADKHIRTPKYVLEANISGYFADIKIDRSYLFNKLNTSPKIRKQIKTWFKSGVIDSNSLFPRENVNSQGRVISPLLANIALHSLEKVIKDYSKKLDITEQWGEKYRQINLQNKIMQMGFIRYANNFVVLHEELSAIIGVLGIIEKWLKDIGLQLENSKTKIVHTLNEHHGSNPGFDFLGFNLRNYRDKRPDIHKRKTSQGTPQEFVSLIKPSKEAIKVHQETLSKIIRKSGKSITQEDLICKLNPVIRKFTNYYHKSVCWSEQSAKLDHLIYLKLRRWALRRHPRKGGRWVKDKYWWDNRPGHKWEFKTKNGVELLKYSDYKVKIHIKTPTVVNLKAQDLKVQNLKVQKTRYDHNACIHNKNQFTREAG